jgi:hypothetical protein
LRDTSEDITLFWKEQATGRQFFAWQADMRIAADDQDLFPFCRLAAYQSQLIKKFPTFGYSRLRYYHANSELLLGVPW